MKLVQRKKKKGTTVDYQNHQKTVPFLFKRRVRSKKKFSEITKYRRKATRTGCNAKIHCMLENGKQVISQVSLEQNHPLEDRRHVIGSHTKTSLCTKLRWFTRDMKLRWGEKGVQSSNKNKQFATSSCSKLTNAFRISAKIIITDKNKLMVDAIKAVLPDAEHRIGISYICQNALKHLSALYMQPGFESLLYECIFYCRTEEEFESKWVSFVKTHGSVVYTSQEKDGLVCSSRKNFHAGPQHGEDIKNIIEIPQNGNTGLSQFIQKYLEVAERWRLEELYEDFCCNEAAQVKFKIVVLYEEF